MLSVRVCPATTTTQRGFTWTTLPFPGDGLLVYGLHLYLSDLPAVALEIHHGGLQPDGP